MDAFNTVLIHGWGGSKDSLAALADELDLPTEVIELPGFGNTPLDKAYSLSDYADYVLPKLTEAQVCIGHSLGGKILLKLGSEGKLGDKIIVLVNSSGVSPKYGWKHKLLKFLTVLYSPIKFLLLNLGLKDLQYALQRAFYKIVVRARDYEKLNEDPLLKETFRNVIDEHISTSDLGKIGNRTLIIWGAQDAVTPLWMGQTLEANIPGAKLMVVEDGTHGLPLKDPAKVAAIVLNYLAEQA